jgi:hypothetical protein
MILIIDDRLLGTEEVSLICFGLGYLNWVLLLLQLSKKVSIVTTVVAGVNLLILESLKIDLINISH